MREATDWNSCYQFGHGAPAIGFDLIRTSDGDVRELPIPVVYEVHVIGDRSSLQERPLLKGRLCAKYLRLTDVFQSYPYLVALRAHGDVWAERACLWQLFQNLVGCRIYNRQFGSEAGAHESITTVGTKHGHPRAIGHFNAPDFLHLRGIDYGHIVLASHGNP
jgi:hypothetical protein